ncbi:hypothetical protein E2C01_046741 [Portunus trituberculatus]|uniref:Uncharacterized protein n=1 Tax=Portunus trituberculatus TaxID=210409 RepID=A0A5B7G1S1_PORTR|nr:hypothetical protein [Portunus trituberculatus]
MRDGGHMAAAAAASRRSGMKDAALACLSPTWRFYLPMSSLPEMWRTPMCKEGEVTSASPAVWSGTRHHLPWTTTWMSHDQEVAACRPARLALSADPDPCVHLPELQHIAVTLITR